MSSRRIGAARFGHALGDGLAMVNLSRQAIYRPSSAHSRDVFFADGDIAVLTPKLPVMDHDGSRRTPRDPRRWGTPSLAEKGGATALYAERNVRAAARRPRYLLGPSRRDTGKVFLDAMAIPEKQFREFHQVRIVACGTRWHAGMAAQFMIERLGRLPGEVDMEVNFATAIRSSIRILTVASANPAKPGPTAGGPRKRNRRGSPRWNLERMGNDPAKPTARFPRTPGGDRRGFTKDFTGT